MLITSDVPCLRAAALIQGGVLPPVMVPDNNDEVSSDGEIDESEEEAEEEEEEEEEEEIAVTRPTGGTSAGISKPGGKRRLSTNSEWQRSSEAANLERLRDFVQQEFGVSLEPGWTVRTFTWISGKTDVRFTCPLVRG